MLLAVAKDRFDLVDDNRPDTADALVRGTRLAHPGLADKYRQALRQVGPGPARARVCEIAQGMSAHKQDEARAAAIDAGYLPADERDRVVFLYLTRAVGTLRRGRSEGAVAVPRVGRLGRVPRLA